MYAQNPCYAYILCSIIIETRPQKGHSQHDKVKSLKLIERMTNIVIIFVLSTNATCCILWDKNKNIYATFLIIFVGEAVFMFQKIILELTLIDNPIDLNCLYNKFP